MKQSNNARGYQQGNILIVAVLTVLLFFISTIGSSLLASQLGLWNKREPTGSRFAGGGVPTGGCYLQDPAFRDTTSITTVDQVLDALPNQRGKLSKVKDELKILIDKSRAANINPGIMIAFWGAEQSFNMKDGVFGCDCPPGEACPRHDKYKGMAGQLDCALPIIEDAIQNRGNYTNPKGQNTWTRLLYNYVAGARKQSYDRYGYVSDSSETRIWFLRRLVPSSITCEAATFANKLPDATGHVFPLQIDRVKWFGGWLNDRCGGTGSGHPHAHGGVDIMHAKDEKVPVYAVVDGVIVRTNRGNFRLKSTNPNDHYTYFYTHLSEVFVKVGSKVKAGQQVAKSGGYNAGARGDHTHFSVTVSQFGPVEVPLTSCRVGKAQRASSAAQLGIINPQSLLESWKKNQTK